MSQWKGDKKMRNREKEIKRRAERKNRRKRDVFQRRNNLTPVEFLEYYAENERTTPDVVYVGEKK